MNKNALRRLLAAVMAAAMLLCSAAFAANEGDVSAFEGDFSSFLVMPVPDVTDKAPAESDDSANVPAEDEAPAETEEPAAEDSSSEEGEPAVEEVPAEDDETEVDGDAYKIAPMYMKEHKHELVFDEEKSFIEPHWDCNYIDEQHHKSTICIANYYTCALCGDYKVEHIFSEAIEEHFGPDEYGNCGGCNDDRVEFGAEDDPEDLCSHENAVWEEETSDEPVYLYDPATLADRKEILSQIDPSQVYTAAEGHFKFTWTYRKGECPECGEVTEERVECLDEPHTFVNGKCVCGYAKTAAKADDRVRSATELVNQIKMLVKDGAFVTITDEAAAYTAEEFAAVSAIADPVERVLVLMAALNLGDEVDHTVKYLGLTLSDEAKALIETVKARVAADGVTGEALLAFPVIRETINKKVYDAIHIEIVATKADGAVVRETFCFYKDGSKWYFNAVEIA